MLWRVQAFLRFAPGSGNAAHAQANMDVTRGQAQPIGPTSEPVVSEAVGEVYRADFPLSGDAQGESRANTAADWLSARTPHIVVDDPGGSQGEVPFVLVQRCYHDESPSPQCVVVRIWPPRPFDPWRAGVGGHETYPLGWVVTHNGQTWRNTGSASNLWEPGVFGWVVV